MISLDEKLATVCNCLSLLQINLKALTVKDYIL